MTRAIWRLGYLKENGLSDEEIEGMISGESERADGDPREALRDHDEFSEDDEIGVPAGLRAAEESRYVRPDAAERA